MNTENYVHIYLHLLNYVMERISGNAFPAVIYICCHNILLKHVYDNISPINRDEITFTDNKASFVSPNITNSEHVLVLEEIFASKQIHHTTNEMFNILTHNNTITCIILIDGEAVITR